MLHSSGQLGRRNVPSRRIKPSLPFSGEPNFSKYPTVSGGTRPPVVGREVTLDPERTKRYDSSEDHLSQYFKALEQKTAAGQRRASAVIDGDISDISLSSNSDPKNAVGSRGAQFLKSNLLKTQGQGPGDAAPARSAAVSIQPTRTSSALQKALAFSSKYKPAKKPSEDVESNREFPEKINSSEHRSEPDPVSKSESSSSLSSQGFLNIRDLIDLPSLSDSKSEHSLSKINSSTHSEESENDVSQEQQPLSASEDVSGHKSEDDASEYEEDFEDESAHSEASLVASEDPVDDEDAGSVESRSTGSGVCDAKSSDEYSKEVAEARKFSVAEKPASARSQLKVLKGNNKETQTSDIFTPKEPVANVAIVRNFPEVAQPRFSSCLEGLSLSALPISASDEMLRQHLRTIRLFKDAQQKSYEMLVTALKPNFRYTTWEHTNKVLEKQRHRRRCRTQK